MDPLSPNIDTSLAMLSNQDVHLIKGYDGLIISPDSARVYFALREGENHYLQAMDADTHEVVATYPAGRQSNIKGFSPDSTLAFALDPYTSSVYKINTTDHTVSDGTRISPRPLTDMVIHPNGKFAYICADQYLLEFNTESQTVTRSLFFLYQSFHPTPVISP